MEQSQAHFALTTLIQEPGLSLATAQTLCITNASDGCAAVVPHEALPH